MNNLFKDKTKLAVLKESTKTSTLLKSFINA